MAIFAVFRVLNPAALGEAVKRAFPNDHYDLGNGQWLVAAKALTAKEVCDKLGVTNNQNGGAVVFAMASYFGRAPTPIWDWIKAKAEATNG